MLPPPASNKNTLEMAQVPLLVHCGIVAEPLQVPFFGSPCFASLSDAPAKRWTPWIIGEVSDTLTDLMALSSQSRGW